MKGLQRQAFLFLSWERQEQPGSSFVWSSCENAWSPVKGPGRETLCESVRIWADLWPEANTICKPRDLYFLQVGSSNGVKMNTLQETFLSACSYMEGLMLKLKLQYFGHLMQRADSLEETLILGKIEGGRRRGWQRMRWLDGISDPIDMSLSNSRNWWWTEKPGVLQSTGLRRVGQDSDWIDWLGNWAKVWEPHLELASEMGQPVELAS